MYLKIQLIHPRAKAPTRGFHDDAGLDVFTPIDVHIPSKSSVVIPVGWKCEFPKGWALIACNKSGLATKNELDNLACIVDSGYRGEVHCQLYNHSGYPVKFKAGDKITQVLLVPVWDGIPEIVSELSGSDRGEGRFGSTGK